MPTIKTFYNGHISSLSFAQTMKLEGKVFVFVVDMLKFRTSKCVGSSGNYSFY